MVGQGWELPRRKVGIVCGGEGERGGRVGMLGFGVFLHEEEFEAEVVQLGTEVS